MAKAKKTTHENTVDHIIFTTANGGTITCNLDALIGMFNAQQEDIEASKKQVDTREQLLGKRIAEINKAIADRDYWEQLATSRKKELETADFKRRVLGDLHKARTDCGDETNDQLKMEIEGLKEQLTMKNVAMPDIEKEKIKFERDMFETYLHKMRHAYEHEKNKNNEVRKPSLAEWMSWSGEDNPYVFKLNRDVQGDKEAEINELKNKYNALIDKLNNISDIINDE